MKCPACECDNGASARFCSQCGASLESMLADRCGRCRSILVPGSSYCHHCGSPAAPDKHEIQRADQSSQLTGILGRLGPQEYLDQLHGGGAVQSERRTVTTMFVDVVNSTGMAESLDPEDITAIMNTAFAAMAEPIQRHGGTLARLMGDGMLCLFGAPKAHEDDALRACRASLDIIAGVAEMSICLCRQYGLASFSVRIGISTGLAVVGEVGTSLRAEYTAMGDAVNLAARLQHAAEPGTALICEETWRLVRERVASQSMGTMQVRGRSQSVNTYRLMQTPRVDTGGAGVAASSPLVGRREELRAVCGALDRLTRGQGGMLVITGRAGIGKSRLIDEARRSATSRCNWVQTQCAELTHATAFAATRDILSTLNGSEDTPDHRSAERIRRTVRKLYMSAKGQHPDVGNPHVAVCAVINHLLLHPLQKQERVFLESLETAELSEQVVGRICDFLVFLAREYPLVICCEDVHWVDPESRAVLERLRKRLHEAPLLLLLTYRSGAATADEVANLMHPIDGAPMEQLDLLPLGNDECSLLLSNLVSSDVLSPAQLRDVVEAAEGNAFFLQEMLRAVMDQRRDGRVAGKRDASEVPHSIQSAVLARVDRLPSRCKQVIRAASVVGRSFSAPLLARMFEPELSISGIENALDILSQREFVGPKVAAAPSEADHTRCQPPDSAGEFQFAHGLIQEVVYKSLLKTEIRRLHHRVASSLEALCPDSLDELAVSLAFHYDRGDDADRAIQYLERSAQQASEVGAFETATHAYRRAIELFERPGVNAPVEKQNVLRLGYADLLFEMADYSGALQQYDLVISSEQRQHQLAALHRKRGRLFERLGQFDQSRHAYETAIETMNKNLDEGEAGRVYAGLSLVYYHRQELETATELALLALSMEENVGDERGIAQSCNNLGVILRRSGQLEQAREYLGRCLAILEARGDQYGLAVCHNNLGLLDAEAKRWPSALDHLELSLRLFEVINNRHGAARAHDSLGELYDSMGDPQKSQHHLEKAVTILSEIGRAGTGLLPEMWQSGMW